MPLAVIHAKRFTNSLSCEQMIGRGSLEVKIQVGIRSRGGHSSQPVLRTHSGDEDNL